MFHGAKLLQIQQLTFEQPEEIFYHSIVQTVSLAAHALSDPLLAKHPLVLLVLILPTLIRVENQACSGRDLCKRLVQHGGYHAEYRMIRYGVTDQIAAAQIKDGREIELLSKQTELCHIGDPLLVRLFGAEVPIQQIRCDFAHFSLIRAILLHPDTANQAQLLHQPLDSLVVQEEIALVKFCCNAAIAVSSFVFMVDGRDLRFDSFILIYTVYPLQMIVESCTGQLSD